jgi:DNA modification methylase
MIEFYNKDCLEAMRATPDKFYDLAIVDPPYGNGETDGNGGVYTLTDLENALTATSKIKRGGITAKIIIIRARKAKRRR